jgi:pyruvate formate lyase activating enzyme
MAKEKISKREFLKRCAFGTGIMALGIDALDAKAFKNSKGVVPIDIWKWHKLAHYYTKVGKNVQCKLCPNEHILEDGERSPCRSRVVYNGDLYSIGYGNPCTVNVDPVEKKPLMHFLPSTKAFSVAVAGCTFSCLNCQNWQISQVSPFDTENYDLFPSETVAGAVKAKCASIAFTYSEATTYYEYMYDTSKISHEKGLKNIYVSNGYINEKPLRDLCKYIDAANINLKSFKEAIYAKLNNGHLENIKNTLKTLKEEGVWLEITNLVIPQWTDDLKMIGEMCAWLVKSGLQDCPLHFSRFFPLYKLTSLPSTPESVLNNARKIAMDAGMKYVYIGNVPGSEAQNTYCPSCKKMLIERRGYTIISNDITEGKCKYCSAEISGVWK